MGIPERSGTFIDRRMTMKETDFYILLNMKTCDGPQSIGKFYIGNQRLFAYSLFHLLKGKREVNEETVLTMELMETVGGLPANLQIITCSLDEISYNCKIITKEVFKLFNLEPQW